MILLVVFLLLVVNNGYVNGSNNGTKTAKTALKRAHSSSLTPFIFLRRIYIKKSFKTYLL